MLILHLVIVALAACELRWRWTLLRVILTVFATLELQFATGLGHAYREAVANPHRVVLPTSRPPQPASEFTSGVLVMYDEAQQDLKAINFPLGVLVWLAISPILRDVISRRRKAQPNQDSSAAA